MAKRYKFGVNLHIKELQRKDPVDTRRGWIKEYQEERRVEVKVGENNVLEYSYILFLARYLIIFSIDIRNHITYTIGYNRKDNMTTIKKTTAR